ncbi:helix-turn-helix transcriptional regulator [Phaeobacter sp.]|uniref:helix-turn-helix domain-containing protein n=1 Tax=Phaeobacter sp. TaxID=1902409 RepID=UPI0025EAB0F2|nr:helix-turn-helix transcriptional regulator [Phaeobacter sp.]
MHDDFARNLRKLCAETGSIAKVCRAIGINRQQFNRYLNGHGLPSAHNLHRIASYFQIDEDALFLPHADFRQSHSAADPLPIAKSQHFDAQFAGQAKPMRRFLGFYHGYYRTPTWPGHVMRTLIRLRAQDHQVRSDTIERANTPDGSIRQRARYRGRVAYHNNRICMYESPRDTQGFLSETVLMPVHPQQTSYVQGLVLGISARVDQPPYAARTVWVRISNRTTLREALAATGLCRDDSPRLDPKVRRLLGNDLPLSITAPE